MTDEMSQQNMTVADASLQALDTAVDSVVAEHSFRGSNGFAAAQISELDRREMRARMEHPFSYTISDTLNSPDGDRYRSGREDGRSYFTVDDCVRLFEDRYAARFGAWRSACALEQSEARCRMNVLERPAAAYACGDAVPAALFQSRSDVVFANGSAGMAVVNRSKGENALVSFFKKYLEAPTVLMEKHSFRLTSGAIAAVSLVLVFAMLLSLPVVMKILIHKEAGVIAELDKQIRTAEAEVTQLEIALDQKNDRVLLEQLATDEYRMVRLDHSDYSILRLHPEDAVETMEKEKSGGAVPALLKALGLRSDD